MTGSIPPELGSLDKMYQCYLISNQLTGTIPPELGDLSTVGYLRLDDNQLAGPIPFEITDLTTLKPGGLFLCDNHLYTLDTTVRDFLVPKAIGWESCQSVVFYVEPGGVCGGGNEPCFFSAQEVIEEARYGECLLKIGEGTYEENIVVDQAGASLELTWKADFSGIGESGPVFIVKSQP